MFVVLVALDTVAISPRTQHVVVHLAIFVTRRIYECSRCHHSPGITAPCTRIIVVLHSGLACSGPRASLFLLRSSMFSPTISHAQNIQQASAEPLNAPKSRLRFPLTTCHSLKQATSAPASPSSPPDVVVVQHPSPPQPMRATVGASAAGGALGETGGGSSSSSSSSPGSSSPGAGGGGAAPPDANELYEEEEEGEELEMHSKAFHTIGQLKSLRDRAKSDRSR